MKRRKKAIKMAYLKINQNLLNEYFIRTILLEFQEIKIIRIKTSNIDFIFIY